MSEIVQCIMDNLPRVLSRVFDVDEETIRELIINGKIKASPTPDPKYGDYGIPIHILLKDTPRDKWGEIGNTISQYLYQETSEKCSVEKVEFLNGYINVVVSYHNILEKIARDHALKTLYERLEKIGNGSEVIVEHTSANPVHPLHIGSGRNSVLGDSYARLLKKLGFNVKTRFYVNDLGRQVVILVYGVRILESKGVRKPEDMKVDHWYGVVYALTNILIEQSILRKKLKNSIDELFTVLDTLCNKYSLDMSKLEPSIKEIVLKACEVSWKKNLKQDILKHLKTLSSLLKEATRNRELMQKCEALQLLRDKLKEVKAILREYSEYQKAEKSLSIHYPDIHTIFKSAIKDYNEVEKEIKELMQSIEKGDIQALELTRRITREVVEGFKQTLCNLDIEFHGFDYESSSEILEGAHRIVEDLIKTKYARIVEGGAVEIDLNSAAYDHAYIKDLFHPDQAGRFIIRRSDGTTLYVTRDIAYTLYKFRDLNAQKVYNVVAVEQSREQKQLKSILYLLGFTREAENLYHFAYEMVHLKGMKMSGRRGTYYTLDELLVDLELKNMEKMYTRETKIEHSELRKIARKIAVGSVRGLMLSVDPSKVMIFEPEKVGEFEYTTLIQYAFVRAQGIVRNLYNIEYLEDPDKVFKLLRELLGSINKQVVFSIEEKKLIELLMKFENVMISSYREMKPNKILEYALELSLEFNKFYEKHPVIGERDINRKNIKAILTTLVLIVISELMDIIGIPKLVKM